MAPAAEQFARPLILPRLATAAASLLVQVVGWMPRASFVLGVRQKATSIGGFTVVTPS